MKIFNDDCLNVMKELEEDSVDVVITDPPYFKFKKDDWDHQWEKENIFLEWLDLVLIELHRLLKPNGSLYMFASPQMTCKVETLISKRFNVLNSIRWYKYQGTHKRQDKEMLRKYQSPWESIIFAEHFHADSLCKSKNGYHAQIDALRAEVFEPIRAYLDQERIRSGLKDKEARQAMGLSTKGGGLISHFWVKAQWMMPTEENYIKLQRIYKGFFLRDYSGLKEEYEGLKEEYEGLKEEYEGLRRPFNSGGFVNREDIWFYDPVSGYANKHPCEKPRALLDNAIKMSTKEKSVILDCFMGTGSAGISAIKHGHDFIGIEKDSKYFALAEERLNAVQLMLPL